MQDESLDQLLAGSWEALGRGAGSARHPFHTGVISTLDPTGPDLRTVVLRGVDAERRALLCHTDARSRKVEQLHDPRVGWLFYDPRAKCQLRLYGKARLYRDDDVARRSWEGSSASSRRCYGVDPAPGTPLLRAGSGLPDTLLDRSPAEEETEGWFERFAVIETRVDRLDWLLLGAQGHRRAQFCWDGDELSATWVVP